MSVVLLNLYVLGLHLRGGAIIGLLEVYAPLSPSLIETELVYDKNINLSR